MRSNHRILECHDLRKSFGDLVAVNGISFHISEGETYGLLGPNGAGKTTTISMICGLLERDGGEVLIDGAPLTPTSVRVKAGISYVPQELAIYPDLTARENLRFGRRSLPDISPKYLGSACVDDSQIVRVTADRYNTSGSYGIENLTPEEIGAGGAGWRT